MEINQELIDRYRNEDGEINWGKLHLERLQSEGIIGNQSPVTGDWLPVTKKKYLELGELRAFKIADELSDYVWEIVKRWDYFAKKTAGDQYVRSTDSIGANIAEGYGRYFFGDYVVFLYYSRGSLEESIFWTEKARRRGLVNAEEFAYLTESFSALEKELNGLIRSVKKQSKKWAFEKGYKKNW